MLGGSRRGLYRGEKVIHTTTQQTKDLLEIIKKTKVSFGKVNLDNFNYCEVPWSPPTFSFFLWLLDQHFENSLTAFIICHWDALLLLSYSCYLFSALFRN